MNENYNIHSGGASSIPDYVAGRLLYFDEFGNDNMRWVLYNGNSSIRFPTRTEAEKYAWQHATEVSEESINYAMVAFSNLVRAANLLHRAANKNPDQDIRLQLEQLSVYTRKLSDKIDILISQQIKK